MSAWSLNGPNPSRLTLHRVVDKIKNPYGPLFDNNGAIGDPASTFTSTASGSCPHLAPLGVGNPVLLANWTLTDQNVTKFDKAARNQLSYLFNDAPHTDDGAISHRLEQVQLW